MHQVSYTNDETAVGKLDTVLFGSPNQAGRRAFHIAASAAVILFCAWLGLQAPILFPLDDAYITLHNAAVLLSGSDPNYLGTPALAGATSAIHLALVAAGSLFLAPTTASFAVASGAVLLYVLGLARLAFHFSASPVLAALVVAIGTLSGYAPYHLFNGLETSLAMAAVTWTLVFALQEKPGWQLPLLCGLMPFIRPELAALSGLLLGRQAWARHRAGAGAFPILRDALIALLAALPWMLWIRWDTGQFMPATMSAKALFFAEANLPLRTKLSMLAGTVNTMTLVTAYIGFITIIPRSLAVYGLAFLGIFLAAYYVALPGALHHNHFRYLQIILPLCLLAMLCSLRARKLAQYLLVFSAFWIAVTLPRGWDAYRGGNAQTAGELHALASWMKANLPANASVLIHDAGYLAYATDFRMTDLVGLKTPASIPFHREFTGPSKGERRSEAVHRIAMQSGATHAVILNDGNAFWGKIGGYLEQHGWKARTLRPAPAGKYAVIELTPPS